ncbi:hypothetical protein D9613_000700 [Agrocybe pediades]|uniref:Amidohydrolase-related domain-containing protein n=1 Tax=Agrocybe pediades TaxID=84607 RepID=A0A8H4VSG1_9AGAR|nr:hypothetical protein D9613_000700 [Agrocybe pediades]
MHRARKLRDFRQWAGLGGSGNLRGIALDDGLLEAREVLLPGADQLSPASILIDKSSGKIIQVQQGELSPDQLGLEVLAVEWIQAGQSVVLPGLVDAHVHLNEPGRTDWEGFWTGTRAAASGGITTLVDMPLNSLPPTTTVPNLQTKWKAAEGQCHTDVAFWGGVIPGNQSSAHLTQLTGIPMYLKGGVTAVNEGLAETHPVKTTHLSPQEYSTFLTSRPQELETNAISLVVELQKEFPKLRCHIVHLSAASALPIIREAKSAGLPLTVETCFHYLCLNAEDIPAGHAEFKCCPPVREASNRDQLWEALKEGLIDCVVSDHSPCVVSLKRPDDGDLMAAWGGISTLGLGLSLLWTEGKKRGVNLSQVVNWTSKQPAIHAGLENSKGQLQIAYDGDFVLWDPEAEFEVTKDLLQYKNKISPYEGMKLQGQVVQTYLRGVKIYDYATGFDGLAPAGKLI